MVNLSVFCLILFLAAISVKIGQWQGNFGMFLNYIGLLYLWKIVIVSCIDLFMGHFKNFSTLIFSIHLRLKLARNFDMLLNYIYLIYIQKKCYCIILRSFYRALQKFEYVSIFYSFLMTQIGTKFWYVFKLHRSDLHKKISHRIQYILFYRALQEFESIYCSFLMTQIGKKFYF